MSMPDEHIHPSATGLAAQTVEKHQEPQEIVFYAGWVSILEVRALDAVAFLWIIP